MAARMHCDVVLTKFSPPPQEESPLGHDVASQHLAAWRSKRLLLLLAPAGAGKTTLLADLFSRLTAEGETCIWLSLDAQESAPCQFVAHLALALQGVLAASSPEILQRLHARRARPEAALNALMNEMARLRPHTTLFFDNFQESENPETAALISYFLRYLPPGIRIALASRRNLPAPLSWVWNRDWSLCLGWEALRFSDATLCAYLSRHYAGLCLDEREITALTQQTEGWPGAVRLALRSLDRVQNASQQERLALIDRTDFAAPLLDELMAGLPPSLHAFMLESALFDPLTPALCDAVLCREDSATCLKQLEAVHFLARQGDGEHFHYPRLIASYLSRRLHIETPSRPPALYAQAGHWFAARARRAEAITHWLHSHEKHLAVDTLSRHGHELLCQHGATALKLWLSRLPEGMPAPLPELYTLQAWCALFSGSPQEVSLALDMARRARASTMAPSQSGEATEWLILQTLSACASHDWTELPGLADAPLPDHPLLRTGAALAQALVLRYRDELPLAQAACREAAELAECHQLHHLHALALHVLAIIDLLQARPDRALARLARTLSEAPQHPSHGLLYTLQAEALTDRGQDEEAALALDTAIDRLELAQLSDHLGLALILRAGLHTEKNRIESAHIDLARARSLGLRHGISRLLFRADLCEAALCLTQNAADEAHLLLERAARQLKASGQSEGENVEVWQALRCAWLITTHRYEEAHDLATEGERKARTAGRLRHGIDFLLLRAIALTHLPGQQSASRDCIEQARQLAKNGGVSHPFRRLVPNLEAMLQHNETALAAPPLNQPHELHQREEQILRLLEQGLRNREIATRLFLSDETVKWYLKRLYGNFAVENRVQLLAAVRKSGLLNDAL